jgi:hypothetical protein
MAGYDLTTNTHLFKSIYSSWGAGGKTTLLFAVVDLLAHFLVLEAVRGANSEGIICVGRLLVLVVSEHRRLMVSDQLRLRHLHWHRS